jgi:UPF0755 protein
LLRQIRGRIVLLLCVLLVTLNLGKMAVQQSYNGPGALKNSQDIVVPQGRTEVVAKALVHAGVIDYPLVFRVAAYLTRHQGPIHAGEFLFPAHASLRDILHILRFAAPVEHQVTIPEGLTGRQIAALINAVPAATGKITAPPDGSILPQTYDFTRGTPRATILRRAAAALQKTVADEWPKRDTAIPLQSSAQAIILASIVQQETPIAAELPVIAAVYQNRLARGMKLQADPTVIYAASNGTASSGQPITRAELANPSLYNTYVNNGLPPGPICAPGIAAIHAVLHPAKTSALFFVATGTGGHVFADTFKQQLSNIAKYRAGFSK